MTLVSVFRKTTELSRRLPLWAIALLTLALITVLLWLPFGINIAEFSDTWVNYHAIEQGTMPLIDLQGSRPLYAVTYYFSHLLTPNSFVGANLLLMTLMWGKACIVYTILRLLIPKLPQLAFFAAALYLLFPADTGQFWLITTNIYFPVFMYLLAVALLLWYWRSPHWLKLVLMAAALAVSFSYEASYVLILVTPLCLLALEKRLSRRVLVVSAIWYVVPALMFARLAVLYIQGSSAFTYQQSVLQLGGGGANSIHSLLSSLVRIYERNIYATWVESAEGIRANFSRTYAIVAVVSAGIAALAGWLHARRSSEHYSGWLIVGLICVGLAIIGLGFLPYLVTEYRDINYRVFFLSAIGGAVLLPSALYLVTYASLNVKRLLFVLAICTLFVLDSRLPIAAAVAGGLALLILPRRIAYALSVACVLFVGAFALLVQHQHYADMPLRQQWIVQAITEQAPSLSDRAFVVLLDDTPDMRGYQSYEWRRDVFTSMLAYVYQQPSLRSGVCAPNKEVWGYFGESCSFQKDGLSIAWNRGEELIPYQDLVVFQYSDATGADLVEQLPASLAPISDTAQYAPDALIDQSAPLPPRLYTLFAHFPFEQPPQAVDFATLR